VESGGDNLAASFSPELVDVSIYVIDVAGGDKIPRKGGPGITRSDLLVINKIDLAPFVGASLEVMERDSRRMRRERPFVFTNLKSGDGLPQVLQWLDAERETPRRAIIDAHAPYQRQAHSHEHTHGEAKRENKKNKKNGFQFDCRLTCPRSGCKRAAAFKESAYPRRRPTRSRKE